MEAILIISIILAVVCILLMRRITIIEEQKFELNERLNMSDEEYIDLFKENIKIKDELSSLKVLQRIKNL
jgi:hypothetical protein